MTKNSPTYNLTIQTVDGLEVNTDTNNLEEAIANFQPQFITGKVLLIVKKGDRKYEKQFFVPAARRLFYNGFARKLLARNIERSLL